MTATDDLAFALHLADLADAVSMPAFRGSLSVRTKFDGTFVTEADEGIERRLREAIAAAHPDDAVLGEEEGGGDSGPRRWIIDPIDATHNFAWGIPIWATLIALEDSGEIVAGVVSAPALGERYDAARGAGARRNGEPIAVSEVGELAASRVAYTSTAFPVLGKDRLFRIVRSVAATRGFGDFWGHMLVAAGALDAMVEPVAAVWDLAPLIVIVEEAGGRLTDLEGTRRVDGGDALSSNGRVHEALLRLLAPG